MRYSAVSVPTDICLKVSSSTYITTGHSLNTPFPHNLKIHVTKHSSFCVVYLFLLYEVMMGYQKHLAQNARRYFHCSKK